MSVLVVQSLKAAERKLTELTKQVGRLQSDLANAEAKLKSMSLAQSTKSQLPDQIFGILNSVLGGSKWGTLSKVALMGYKQYKGRKGSGNAKALPSGQTPDGDKHA